MCSCGKPRGFQWRIQGGQSAPHTTQNILNFMQFWENLTKPYVGAPTPLVSAPPHTGNPGSAPGLPLSAIWSYSDELQTSSVFCHVEADTFCTQLPRQRYHILRHKRKTN